MKNAIRKLLAELGAVGWASLAVLAAMAAFSVAVVKPLEERKQRLDRGVEAADRRVPGDGMKRVNVTAGVDVASEFYKYFDRKEHIEDWLAKLYGVSAASRIELRAGNYRLIDSRQRLDRYEISLPVTGTYAEIRSFLEAALAEIPLLSLDQATFRRKGVQERRIEADVVLTLHLLRK